MQRFHIWSQEISGNKIIVSDIKQLHHLKSVLRLKVGEKVTVFDGLSREYVCVVEQTYPQFILGIKQSLPADRLLREVRLTIACAIPKKSKMDDIIDKLTQLGVDKIIPLETQRVVIKLDVAKKRLRHQRWEKIALAAAQQSQRKTLPVIEEVKNLAQVLSASVNYDLKLIPALFDRRQSLRQILAETRPKNIIVLIGPEGDFTPQELNLARKADFIPLSLGDLVLRVETAAVAVASYIMLHGSSREIDIVSKLG
jgi:16S rRNA (uracil1498-N3)-methyltransferase